ncbi:MAG TPA: FAD-dependent oxidoreductase [Opitutaceae bacterium]|nr:FAD-dependent oxidoreductase [Opitutaceae bacterium]
MVSSKAASRRVRRRDTGPGRPQTLVVVGNGMVGWRFCHALVERGLTKGLTVTVIGEEPRPAYDRIHLADCLDGRTAADLQLAPREWYEANGLSLVTGDPVVNIDRVAGTVLTRSGRRIGYDRLVLATGSRPYVPPIPGTGLPGVFVMRTIEDIEALRARAGVSRTAAVIGGGLLGLEAANALLKLGLHPIVLERGPGLMARQLSPAAAALLKEKVEALGVEVRLAQDSKAIQSASGGALAVEIAGHEILTVDLVVIAAGIRPRHELAEAAGLACDRRGGITIGDNLATSDPRIFAIGECAAHRGMIYGLAAPGYQMAEALADRIAGQRRVFRGGPLSARLKLLGIEVAALGEFQDAGESTVHASTDTHCELIFRRGRLVGAISVGPNPEAARLQDAVDARQFVWPWRRNRFSETGRLWSEQDATDPNHWPAGAIVCNCRSVTRGVLSQSCRTGCTSVAELSATTGAGSVCGSCRPLLAQIAGDRELTAPPVGGRRWLLGACALVAGAVIFGLLRGPFATGTSIELRRWIDIVWTEPAWQRATGFTILGVVAATLLLSLRKRIPRISWGDFGWWRVLHAGLGVLGLVVLVAHTGLRLGNNFNRVLMLDFIALIAVGALAGTVTSLEAKFDVRTARRLRSFWTWSHIVLVWPLPVLLIFHVLSAYYF